jgi:hypothetical protein
VAQAAAQHPAAEHQRSSGAGVRRQSHIPRSPYAYTVRDDTIAFLTPPPLTTTPTPHPTPRTHLAPSQGIWRYKIGLRDTALWVTGLFGVQYRPVSTVRTHKGLGVVRGQSPCPLYLLPPSKPPPLPTHAPHFVCVSPAHGCPANPDRDPRSGKRSGLSRRPQTVSQVRNGTRGTTWTLVCPAINHGLLHTTGRGGARAFADRVHACPSLHSVVCVGVWVCVCVCVPLSMSRQGAAASRPRGGPLGPYVNGEHPHGGVHRSAAAGGGEGVPRHLVGKADRGG